MPAVLADVVVRQAVNVTTLHNTTIAVDDSLQVICAWPVSGQYGPGSRILYYVLVAICVLARKSEWLRNACLAATLLIPMVAALHGIVLAAVHVQNAVDLDIYGAFQLCAIGVLVAPVTAKLSRTYFNGPGHNVIILWSFIVVAGLISLTVEFIRVANNTFPCWQDDSGKPLSSTSAFPYGEAFCGLECSPDKGPVSPIRLGSGNNIYVIPVPHALTFNVGILLSAACCIPAILLVVALLLRSFKANWNTRFVNKLSLRLRAFVFVFEAGTEAPSIRKIQEHFSSLHRLGIVRTSASRRSQHAITDVDDHMLSMGNGHVRSPNTSERSLNTVTGDDGFARMFHDLRSRSTLTQYQYEISGSSLQVLEFKLAEYITGDEIAIELRMAIQDLDKEGVDAIVVEGLPSGLGERVDWIMDQLRNDQDVRKEGTKASGKTSRTGSLLEKYTMGTIFGILVIAILIIGERNFWLNPVNYQTEPIGNIGQWAPIAGTALLMIGSIYVLAAEQTRKERRRQRMSNGDDEGHNGYVRRLFRLGLQFLVNINDMLSPQRKRFDDSGWATHAQQNYPTVPGEEIRSPELQQTMTNYSYHRNSASSFRSNTSQDYSPWHSRAVSRERSESDATIPRPLRKKTLTLELPEEVHTIRRPRRSTQISQTGVLPTGITSTDDHITLVVTSPHDSPIEKT